MHIYLKKKIIKITKYDKYKKKNVFTHKINYSLILLQYLLYTC